MSYADHVQQSRRPPCWGEEDQFDPDNDEECAGCRFQHSCRAEINQGGRVRGYRPSYGRPRSVSVRRNKHEDEDVQAEHEEDGPVVLQREESVTSRFFKDVAMGAARGAAYELYRFTKRYRIP